VTGAFGDRVIGRCTLWNVVLPLTLVGIALVMVAVAPFVDSHPVAVTVALAVTFFGVLLGWHVVTGAGDLGGLGDEVGSRVARVRLACAARARVSDAECVRPGRTRAGARL
jgi:hypothetical protein